jgi:hypothetical protein
MKRIDIAEILVCETWIILCFMDGSSAMYDTSCFSSNGSYYIEIEFNDTEFLVIKRNGIGIHRFTMLDMIPGQISIYSRIKNYSYSSMSCNNDSSMTIYTNNATNLNANNLNADYSSASDENLQIMLDMHDVIPNCYFLVDPANDYWEKY